MCRYVSVDMYTRVQVPVRPEVLDALELQFQEAASHLTWAKRMKVRSWARVASALNH